VDTMPTPRAITGYELLNLLELWQAWIVDDRVTEEDDKAVEALEYLKGYLPLEGVAVMDGCVWPRNFTGSVATAGKVEPSRRRRFEFRVVTRHGDKFAGAFVEVAPSEELARVWAVNERHDYPQAKVTVERREVSAWEEIPKGEEK
jgi:hypothetical protein